MRGPPHLHLIPAPDGVSVVSGKGVAAFLESEQDASSMVALVSDEVPERRKDSLLEATPLGDSLHDVDEKGLDRLP